MMHFSVSCKNFNTVIEPKLVFELVKRVSRVHSSRPCITSRESTKSKGFITNIISSKFPCTKENFAPSVPVTTLSDTYTYRTSNYYKDCGRLGNSSPHCLVLLVFFLTSVMISAHGPPQERDNEDVSMGRKMGAKWCGMAKVCNHDRVPICGVSHAGDVMGFRDLCDMFDYNCIRRRNYRQTGCPENKSLLTVSRRPTNSFYDD